MQIVASPIRFLLGDLGFTWDLAKAEDNVRMHGIPFEEAATTWLDPLAIERFDRDHSVAEDRWFRIGASLRGALLVVWSTAREAAGHTVIRIIGARRTTRKERDLYERHARAR